MTTVTAHTTESTARRAPHASGASLPAATRETARRTVLQYLRTPQLLVLPTVIAALFLFLFRYCFGGAIATGTTADYVDFLVPGFLVTVILWTGLNAPAGVAEDASSGVHDRLRSLPIPRAAAMAGRSVADTALNFWTVITTALLGLAVGFRTHGDVGEIVLAFALLLVASYAFSWVFVSLGLVARNAQAAQGMSSLIVVPFAFLSSAYVPIDSMPGWMQSVAENQPITIMINAVRSLLLGGTNAAGVGHSTAYWVTLALLWCAGIIVLFGAIAVTRFARRR
jgi:ABC-2 type transport system permease protein